MVKYINNDLMENIDVENQYSTLQYLFYCQYKQEKL